MQSQARGDPGRRTRNPAPGRQIRQATPSLTGFADVQDYVERALRQRLAALPDGEWETQDFIDRDPAGGEGHDPDQGQADDRRRSRDL